MLNANFSSISAIVSWKIFICQKNVFSSFGNKILHNKKFATIKCQLNVIKNN